MDFLSNDLDEYITNNGKKLPFEKSFASYDGKTEKGKLKIDCWMVEKNNRLTPRDVAKASNKKYWFQCYTCDHTFQSALNNITGGKWCPYCAKCSQYICDRGDCDHCYKKTFIVYDGKTSKGKLKKDCWIVEKNKGLTPRDVTKGTDKDYWFQCDTCTHTFQSKPCNIISKGTWCPYCSIPCKKLCEDINCEHCFQKSFASYDGKSDKGKLKIDCWMVEKNNNLTPRDVNNGTDKKYWFQCDTCDHTFQSSLSGISRGRWCPYCSIPCKKLCEDINCEHCTQRSFAGYEGTTTKGTLKKDCWMVEKNNGLTPRGVTMRTHTKYWFQCDTCEHTFQSALNKITCDETWCPYCCFPIQQICEDINCNHCFQKSFAGYEGLSPNSTLKKDCWIVEKNKGLTPRDVTKASGKKYWFQCDSCNQHFQSALNNITGGNWCPYCVNKTEKKFQSWFKGKYEYKIQPQKRFPWCKNPETNRTLPFDFCIPELKLIIEIDGEQHFRQVWNWKSPELQKERDGFKMKLACENGYTIIRIYQPDIYSDLNDWDKKTEEAIKKYDEPEIIYIGENYVHTKDDMECSS